MYKGERVVLAKVKIMILAKKDVPIVDEVHDVEVDLFLLRRQIISPP